MATVTILGSEHVRSSHRGRMQWQEARYLICCTVPPLVALLMAQAASFLMSNSALESKSTRGGDDVGVNHRLDLLLVPCGDVANRPARLLLDALLVVVGEELEEALQGPAVDDDLRLHIVPRDDVAHRSERRDEDRRRRVHQKLHQPLAHVDLDHGLDPVVRPVREVAESPQGVREDVLVDRSHELGQNGQRGLHLLEGRLGLAPAVVGERPGRVSEHGDLGLGVELREEGVHGVGVEHEVPALWAVAGDVAEGPHRLLSNVLGGGHEELDEDWHGPVLDDDLGVLAGSARDVRESPGGLELELGNVFPLEELHELSHHVGLDHLRYGRVPLDTEKLSEPYGGLQLVVRDLAKDPLNHLRQKLQLLLDGRLLVLVALGGA